MKLPEQTLSVDQMERKIKMLEQKYGDVNIRRSQQKEDRPGNKRNIDQKKQLREKIKSNYECERSSSV